MALEKYRYHVYTDRTYVFEIDKNTQIEISGAELYSLMGLDTYLDAVEIPTEVVIDKRYYI